MFDMNWSPLIYTYILRRHYFTRFCSPTFPHHRIGSQLVIQGLSFNKFAIFVCRPPPTPHLLILSTAAYKFIFLKHPPQVRLHQMTIVVRVAHLCIERAEIVLVVGGRIMQWPNAQWQPVSVARHVLHIQNLSIRTYVVDHVGALVRILQDAWRFLQRHRWRHFRNLRQGVCRVVRHIRRRHHRRAHVHPQRARVVGRVYRYGRREVNGIVLGNTSEAQGEGQI